MSHRVKLLLGIGILCVVIAASVLAYDELAGRVTPYNPFLEQGAPEASVSPDAVPLYSPSPSSREPHPTPTPSSAPEERDEEHPAPDFTVQDDEGNPVKLSDYFGKPIVLNFWASWCPPCRSEMPDFDKVYAELKDEITFLMVDLVGGQETMESGRAYAEQQGLSFPIYYDVDQEAATAYGIMYIPTSYFIDAAGNLVTGTSSAIDEETLRYAIDLIL